MCERVRERIHHWTGSQYSSQKSTHYLSLFALVLSKVPRWVFDWLILWLIYWFFIFILNIQLIAFPDHTVIHQNLCLSQCPVGYWQDDERQCKKCEKDSCETSEFILQSFWKVFIEKTSACMISEENVNDETTMVHSGNIHKFENCSIFHGNLLLTDLTFKEYHEFSYVYNMTFFATNAVLEAVQCWFTERWHLTIYLCSNHSHE